jgi:hypothetical protein
MIALIDSDSLCYGNAFSVEKDGELIENADKFLYSRLESSLNRIMEDTNATDYKVFLTSGGGFRKEVDPNYKANRSGMKRPILLQEARDYLIVVHEALTYDILEAVLSAYSGMKKKSTGEAPTEEDLHRNMQLLYMRRTEEEEWRPPV